VAIYKPRFAALNFEQLGQVNPIAALERFDMRRECIFRPIVTAHSV
jgi:hypothetical protein